MSENESLADRLSRFTPNGASIDRDALLLAAGRASVRRNRGWMALVFALSASQLLTLVLLWPRTPVSASPAEPFLAGEPAATAEEVTDASSPFGLLRLRQSMLANGGELSPRPADDPLVPGEPPWRAFDAISLRRLN